MIGIEVMTRQEMFTKVWEKVNEQGKPCIGKDGLCSYYEDGFRCGIGWLVSEERAKNLEKGTTYDNIKVLCEDLNIKMNMSNAKFLYDLQLCHDDAKVRMKLGEGFLDTFKDRMRRLAKRKRL